MRSAGAHYPVRIVVVPGLSPQVRGYRSEGRGRRQPESLLDDKACKSETVTHTGAMLDLPVTVARSRLDEIVDDVRARHEPVFLTRRGRRVAAVIDVEDLERFTQAAEGLADIEAADAARVEIAKHGTIPWGEVKADLGLA